MEITEATDLIDRNAKVILTMKIELEADGTDVFLQHPILVRPRFFYTIRVGQFPRHHLHDSENLMQKVQLESDIEVEFHNKVLIFHSLNQ